MGQIRIRKAELLQSKPGLPCKNWSIPTTLQIYLFKSYAISIGTILWPSSIQHTPNRLLARCFLRGAKFTNKNDQWSSAARVSASRSTNPWYMTQGKFAWTAQGLWLWVGWGFRMVQIPLAGRHWYCRAQHSWINYQNSAQEITSKTNTEPPKCHWLSATGFQRVQNPGPNKIQNTSKSCSRQTTTSTKRMVSRNLTIRRWERKLTKMNWMDGSVMDEL